MTIKPLAGLTRPLLGLLAADLACCLLVAIHRVFYFVYIAGLIAGHRYGWARSVWAGTFTLARFAWVVGVVASIVFLMWVYRTNHNLAALSGRRLQFTPGESVGWWFCPVLNFVQPYRIMRELWQVSRRFERDRGHQVVAWWWACFIGTTLLSVVSLLSSQSVDTPDGALFYVSVLLAVGLVALGSSLLQIFVVRGIAAGYEKSIAEPAGGAFAPGTAAVAAGAREGGATAAAMAASFPPEWYPDPSGRHQYRYWDGGAWSPAVADDGVRADDPL